MLEENQYCTIKWNSANKNRLVSLGYKFTKMHSEVNIKVEHLSKKSHANVVVICDYCGKKIIKGYHTYCRQHDEEFGDACKECKAKKQKDIFMRKYGVGNASEVPKFQQKRKDTIRKRYGCENPSQIEGVQAKKEATCIKNYGVRIPLQSPIIREKVAETLLQNGTCPTSSQQLKVYEMLKKEYGNCELNKQCGSNILDCVVIIGNIKIDVEYDGSYWHQDEQKDRRRDEVVKSYGYKILRIRGGHKLPTLSQLQEAINYLCIDGNNFSRIRLNE